MKTPENKVSDLQSKIRLLETDLKDIILNDLNIDVIITDKKEFKLLNDSKNLIKDLKHFADNHINQNP